MAREVLTLYDICLKASVKTLRFSSTWNALPRKLIHALIHSCLHTNYDVVAFKNIIQSWPFRLFSLNKLGLRLNENATVILLSLIKKREIGLIRVIDLLERDFHCFPKHVADCTGNLLQLVSESGSMNHENDEELISVAMEVSLTAHNYCSYVKAMQTTNTSIKLLMKRIDFSQMTSSDVVCVLTSTTDKHHLVGVSFSLENISETELKAVFEELVKFENISEFSLNCDIPLENVFKETVSLLPNLRHLDLSHNHLTPIMITDIKTDALTTLSLVGCDMTNDCLHALVSHPSITSLSKLSLSYNKWNGDIKNLLNDLLLKFKHSIQYLDISHSNVSNQCIVNLVPVLKVMHLLAVLCVCPNLGVDGDILSSEIRPLFKDTGIELPDKCTGIEKKESYINYFYT